MVSNTDAKRMNFQIKEVSFVDSQRDKNYKYTFLNGRPNHAFIYVCRGSILYTFADAALKKILIEQDELLFIPKGTKYTATYLEDRTMLKNIQFDISAGDFSSFLDSPEKIIVPNISGIVNKFFDSRQNRFTDHLFHYTAMLYDLFWQIDLKNFEIPTKYSKIQAALDNISLHPEENRKISEYAALCNMSEPNFRKLFKEYIGKSPIDYRNSARLEKAKAKLLSGEYNVSEVAYSCGFTNLSFFTRQYKAKYGYTPKKEY